jgi:hypothetical protein
MATLKSFQETVGSGPALEGGATNAAYQHEHKTVNYALPAWSYAMMRKARSGIVLHPDGEGLG